MFENDPLYDVNHPFYYDPDPDPQVKKEGDEEEQKDDQYLDQAMRQIVSCLIVLVIGFLLLVVGYGVIQLIRMLGETLLRGSQFLATF